MTILYFIIGLIVIVGLFVYLKYLAPLRPKESGFEYVYVNENGTVSELDEEDIEYLKTEFSPADGARPYIKSRYQQMTSDNKISGYISRNRVPKKIKINPRVKYKQSVNKPIEFEYQPTLNKYFSYMYSKISNNWNVESYLSLFGTGKNNEGTDESKGILRYYVTPLDKRFKEIYLNYNIKRNIESIVWHTDTVNYKPLTLTDLKELFGGFTTQNIIYDETTELIFKPLENKDIDYISTSIYEWVEIRKDKSMYYIQNEKEIEINDDYEFSGLIFKIKNA